MEKNKVAIITTGAVGGAERMSILFAKILQKAGINCCLVICSSDEECELLRFVPETLRCEVLVSRYRYLFFHLLAFLIKERPAVVFSSMPTLIRLLAIVKKMHLVNFKFVTRCFNMPNMMSKRSYSIVKRWFRYSDAIVSQTKEMKEEILSHFKIKDHAVVVINNPVDTGLIKEKIQESFPFDKRYVNYVAVGRIGKQKDYQTLMMAFNTVLERVPQARLYIIGGIYERAYYEMLLKIVSELNLQKSVFFEGFQDNPFKYVNGADVFCLSSIFEGLPNVLLEAMYLGCPVVATRCIPFISQVVQEGVNGYTVDVGCYQDFADAMVDASKIHGLEKFSSKIDSEIQIVELFKTYLPNG